MKTENTPEEKAKFFAQYFMQPVFRNKHWVESEPNETVSAYILNTKMELSEGYLLLTSLKNISDEDAIEVAQLITRFKWNLDFGTKVIKEDNQVRVYYDTVVHGFKHTTTIYDDFFGRNYLGDPIQPLSGEVYDFLRSKSYLLPYKDLSTEDLIAYGWAKEKES